MSEQSATPPPPESTPLPPQAPPPQSPGGPADSNKTLMLILSYLGLLALIPFLVEKEDPDVKWHSRNGLCFFAASIALMIVSMILSAIPGVCLITPLVYLGIFVVHVFAIVKALQGSRLVLPFVSDFATKF